MRTLTIILATLALLPGVAGAAEKETTAKPASAAASAPKPAPEMEKLKYFLGTWHCEGTDFATPFGPEHPMKEIVTAKWDLDRFWLVQRIEETNTKANPHPLKGVGALTYDPGQKKFVSTWNDNSGGWAMQTSDGWDGDKLVLVGDYTSGGQKMMLRDTFVKKSAKELVHTGEIKVKDQWMKTDEETWKK